MEDNKQQSGMLKELDISSIIFKILGYIAKFYWLVLLCAAIGASLMWYKAKVSYAPYYQSSVTCTINNDYGSYGDVNYLSTTKSLSNMFQHLTNTGTFRDMLKKELGTDVINGSIGAYVADTSNLLTITVTSGNPQDAYNILLATIKCYPEIADYVVGTVYFHVITPASVPTEPLNMPDYKGPAKKGALLGVAAVFALFALFAVFDNRINSREDIEKRVNAKCLAVIPEIKFKKRKTSKNIPITILNKKVGYGFIESYRALRTKVKKYCEKNGCKVILVTSAMPGEGKTTTSINIALSLAEISDKVVLVDADLRKPAVAERLMITSEFTGINAVLKGEAEVSEALTEVEGSSLKILAGNSSIKNALECMGSEAMKNIIDKLREEFDYVIIDTPPCGIMSDASMISQYADGMIMVVRANKSKVSHISNAASLFAGNGFPVLGCVLNYKSNEIAAGYRYGGYKYGYSKYGRYYSYGSHRRYGGYGDYTGYGDDLKKE